MAHHLVAIQAHPGGFGGGQCVRGERTGTHGERPGGPNRSARHHRGHRGVGCERHARRATTVAEPGHRRVRAGDRGRVVPSLGQHAYLVRQDGMGRHRPREPALVRPSSCQRTPTRVKLEHVLVSSTESLREEGAADVRFSFAESLTDSSFYIPLAKAAEEAGYHSMTIADSIAYPFESDSKYPYTPDGSREFLDGKEIVEAFVLTAALGAVTTNLRFNFFVLKLPVRHPALTAKQAGSLAVLTGNRLGLGVGTSPWPED